MLVYFIFFLYKRIYIYVYIHIYVRIENNIINYANILN